MAGYLSSKYLDLCTRNNGPNQGYKGRDFWHVGGLSIPLRILVFAKLRGSRGLGISVDRLTAWPLRQGPNQTGTMASSSDNQLPKCLKPTRRGCIAKAAPPEKGSGLVPLECS